MEKGNYSADEPIQSVTLHKLKDSLCVASSHRVLKPGTPVEGWSPYLNQPAAYAIASTDREGSSVLSLSCLCTHFWPDLALWYVTLSYNKNERWLHYCS